VAEQLTLVSGCGPVADEVVLEPPPKVATKLAPLAPERFALQLRSPGKPGTSFCGRRRF
jgi:hypothetical protein